MNRGFQAGLVPLAGVAATLALSVLAGCGNDDSESAFTPAAGVESSYCKTYRGWEVHELIGGEGGDQPSPAALRKYWNEFLIFLETSLHQAPPQIRDALEVNVHAYRVGLTPLVEKYDFDAKRIEREGTAAEKALFAKPPPDVQKAEGAIHAYQDRVCDPPQPPPADVVFKPDGSSTPFCTALSTFGSEFAKVGSSRYDPDVMRTFVTGDSFSDVLDELDATAPAVIAADVRAETEWFRTRWTDVLAEFDYDVRRVVLDGTPEDRAVFNRSHPDIAEHTARDSAYGEQVCSG